MIHWHGSRLPHNEAKSGPRVKEEVKDETPQPDDPSPAVPTGDRLQRLQALMVQRRADDSQRVARIQDFTTRKRAAAAAAGDDALLRADAVVVARAAAEYEQQQQAAAEVKAMAAANASATARTLLASLRLPVDNLPETAPEASSQASPTPTSVGTAPATPSLLLSMQSDLDQFSPGDASLRAELDSAQKRLQEQGAEAQASAAERSRLLACLRTEEDQCTIFKQELSQSESDGIKHRDAEAEVSRSLMQRCTQLTDELNAAQTFKEEFLLQVDAHHEIAMEYGTLKMKYESAVKSEALQFKTMSDTAELAQQLKCEVTQVTRAYGEIVESRGGTTCEELQSYAIDRRALLAQCDVYMKEADMSSKCEYELKQEAAEYRLEMMAYMSKADPVHHYMLGLRDLVKSEEITAAEEALMLAEFEESHSAESNEQLHLKDAERATVAGQTHLPGPSHGKCQTRRYTGFDRSPTFRTQISRRQPRPSSDAGGPNLVLRF